MTKCLCPNCSAHDPLQRPKRIGGAQPPAAAVSQRAAGQDLNGEISSHQMRCYEKMRGGVCENVNPEEPSSRSSCWNAFYSLPDSRPLQLTAAHGKEIMADRMSRSHLDIRSGQEWQNLFVRRLRRMKVIVITAR